MVTRTHDKRVIFTWYGASLGCRWWRLAGTEGNYKYTEQAFTEKTDSISRSFMICTPHQTLFRSSTQKFDRWGTWQVWGRGEVYTESWLGNLRKRPLGRPGDKWEDNIKMDLQDIGLGARKWFILLQTGSGGGLSWTWQ